LARGILIDCLVCFLLKAPPHVQSFRQAMAAVSYNPEFDPTGIEGGVDTNKLPWIDIASAPGMSFKPLRVSDETGMFSIVVRMKKGTKQPDLVHLGAMDFMVLSGKLTYPSGPMAGTIDQGTWGYVPSGAKIEGLFANEAVEYLGNFHGPMCFLGNDKTSVAGMLTALDVRMAAKSKGITLVPNTLAECMQPRPAAYQGPPEPLAMSTTNAAALVSHAEGIAADAGKAVRPHYVDTKILPWIVNPDTPEVGLKILRVSEETGQTSLIVKHNGQAPPHYHLGASDFMVLSGNIGYRAGPAEGYGPGMWFYEPAGARHESTQRVGTQDLIYLANVYGPIQFDEGKDTPIAFVLSWMAYKAMADGAGSPLVKNTFAKDATLLAWAPLGGKAKL